MACELKAIVAVCDDWGIGRDGDMVVANRADMRHFVNKTKGHPVIMGRKTLESFPGGRPLRDRRNIVLTRDTSFARDGVEVVHSVDEALDTVAEEDIAWVIGGGAVYEQFLPHCVEAEITRNHVVHPADTFFPNLDDDPEWEAVEHQGACIVGEGQGDVGLRYEFVTYRRRGFDAHDDDGDRLIKFLDTASDIATIALEMIDC